MAEEQKASGPEAQEPATSVESKIGVKDATPTTQLSPEDKRQKQLESVEFAQSINLKRSYGKWILIMMAVQLLVVNTVFVIYAWCGYDWKPPEDVVQVWLAATFVQIVSVVVVITRSLFPRSKEAQGD